MAAKICVLGMILYSYTYLRSAMVRFPLAKIKIWQPNSQWLENLIFFSLSIVDTAIQKVYLYDYMKAICLNDFAY